MFFSVCSTSVGFLLIALNRSVFEYIAHNINYINDFVVALVDSLLVSTVVRSPAHYPGQGGGHLRTGLRQVWRAHCGARDLGAVNAQLWPSLCLQLLVSTGVVTFASAMRTSSSSASR